MVKRKTMIVNCTFTQKHTPSIDYNQFLLWEFWWSHIPTQLGNAPHTLNYWHPPICINKLLRSVVNFLFEFIQNSCLNVFYCCTYVSIFIIQIFSKLIWVKHSITIRKFKLPFFILLWLIVWMRNLNQIPNLRHENKFCIQTPFLTFWYFCQYSWHLVIQVFKFFKLSIIPFLNSKGRKFNDSIQVIQCKS